MAQELSHFKEFLSYKKCLTNYPDFGVLEHIEDYVGFDQLGANPGLLEEYNIPEKQENQNEVEHIFSVIGWMHQNVVHDGYTKYRGRMNVSDLLHYCCYEKKGVNCLMNAIILQELCLAMGYKAHIIQGNPYDYKIMDCHWLVNAYLGTYKKWVIFDPVWISCCFNEMGEPLSVFEIRDYLCTGKKFSYYKDCISEYYTYLLCRYYFFFGIFKHNCHGTFDLEGQQKIYLSPKGFDSKEYISNKEKTRFQPFDIKEYLYFSRHEEKSIHIVG